MTDKRWQYDWRAKKNLDGNTYFYFLALQRAFSNISSSDAESNKKFLVKLNPQKLTRNDAAKSM